MGPRARAPCGRPLLALRGRKPLPEESSSLPSGGLRQAPPPCGWCGPAYAEAPAGPARRWRQRRPASTRRRSDSAPASMPGPLRPAGRRSTPRSRPWRCAATSAQEMSLKAANTASAVSGPPSPKVRPGIPSDLVADADEAECSRLVATQPLDDHGEHLQVVPPMVGGIERGIPSPCCTTGYAPARARANTDSSNWSKSFTPWLNTTTSAAATAAR